MAYLQDLSFGADTRVVLIGTTTCPFDADMLPPVPHAERNIDYLARLLTDPDICGLDDSCIIRVLDRDNASEITDMVARAAREATDTLIVYYVGHGLYGDADTPLYLAARNTTEDGKAYNGVSITLVKKALRSSRARKRILILDCCYSGKAIDGTLAATGPEAAVDPAIDIEGTFGIAAVPANAKALAPPDEKLTRFTGALVDVLERGLDVDRKVLTLEDVFAEVERKIGRKADAPLPKRINWDGGQGFRIARNRSLHRRELDRLYEAVQGLRDTMTTTGAHLQALDARVTAMSEMSARLERVEATLTVPLSTVAADDSASGASPSHGPWNRIGLTERQWDQLPALPYKRQVRRYFAGRRNGLILLASLVYICGGMITLFYASPLSSSPLRYLGALIGSIGLALLVFVALVVTLLKRRPAPPNAAGPLPPYVLELLETNDQLADLMDKPVADLFSFPFDRGLTTLAALFCLTVAAVGIAVLVIPS